MHGTEKAVTMSPNLKKHLKKITPQENGCDGKIPKVISHGGVLTCSVSS